MTMTHERTRSLIEARNVLKDLIQDPTVSENMKSKIAGALRHYPTESDILNAGEFEFLARHKLLSLGSMSVLALGTPFLSPSATYEGEKNFIEHNIKNNAD